MTRRPTRCTGLRADLQLDDVRVPEELEIFDLSLDPAGHVSADELLPGDDLEGDLLVCAAVYGELHLAE